MTYNTSIPTTVLGTDIPTKLVGTVYFDKTCVVHWQESMMRLVQRTMARYEWEAMPTAWYIKVRPSSQQLWKAVFSY